MAALADAGCGGAALRVYPAIPRRCNARRATLRSARIPWLSLRGCGAPATRAASWVGRPPSESPEANARVDSRTKAEGRRIRRNRARGGPRPHHRGRHPHLPVPAVQYSVRLDDGDTADRRLPVRVEIHLWLQPLLVPVLAADLHRPN